MEETLLLFIPSHGVQRLLEKLRVHVMLSFENHALFKCDCHPRSVFSAFTARETTPVQPPADLKPENRPFSMDETGFAKL